MTGKKPSGRPHQARRPAGYSATRAESGPRTAAPTSPPRAVPVAFYGRTATGVTRPRQLALCHAVAAARRWQATAEFLHEDYPLQRRPQGRELLAALSGQARPAGAVAVADPWRLLPSRLAPDRTAILARLAFRHALLILANSGIVISSAEEYALLSRLLTSPPCGAPPGGRASWPSGREPRARSSQPRRAASGQPRHSGESG